MLKYSVFKLCEEFWCYDKLPFMYNDPNNLNSDHCESSMCNLFYILPGIIKMHRHYIKLAAFLAKAHQPVMMNSADIWERYFVCWEGYVSYFNSIYSVLIMYINRHWILVWCLIQCSWSFRLSYIYWDASIRSALKQ